MLDPIALRAYGEVDQDTRYEGGGHRALTCRRALPQYFPPRPNAYHDAEGHEVRKSILKTD